MLKYKVKIQNEMAKTHFKVPFTFVNRGHGQLLIRTFVFEFPCIISLYYIKNQQDATLARSVYMFRTLPASIIRGTSSRPMTYTSGCYYSF